MKSLLRFATGVALAWSVFSAPAYSAVGFVSNNNDSGGGSLREALVTAGADGTVVFTLTPLPATIDLASEISITQGVTITGPGATLLTVRNTTGRAFHLDASAKDVAISGITIAGDNASGNGGAILNDGGNVTLDSVAITGNTASGTGGAIYNNYFPGGNVLQIYNSTLSGNHANKSGAIDFIGFQLVIVDSTIAANTASDSAGAINLLNAEVAIRNSTIAGNSATFVGGINSQSSNLNIESSIIANNTDSTGTNDLNRTGGGTSFVNADHALFSEAFVPGDNVINGTDTANLVGVSPMLDALGNHGGPTQTLQPLAGSPAIGAGSNSLALAYDQRGSGFPRSTGTGVDIGAIQGPLPAPPPPVAQVPVPALDPLALAALAALIALGAAVFLRRRGAG